MSHLEQAYQFDVHIRRDVDEKMPPQGVVVLAKDIEQGIVYENGGVKVTAFEVDHGPVKPAFGYRVDFAGHSVVLSGDTRYSENLIHFSEGADVLIHEVMDPDAFHLANPSTSPERVQRILAHHTTPEQAGTVFARVKPKLAVYSHIVPPDASNLIPLTRKTYSGPLEVGEDLMSIEIGEKWWCNERLQVGSPMLDPFCWKKMKASCALAAFIRTAVPPPLPNSCSK